MQFHMPSFSYLLQIKS